MMDFIRDEIYMYYGVPEEMFSDGGKNLREELLGSI